MVQRNSWILASYPRKQDTVPGFGDFRIVDALWREIRGQGAPGIGRLPQGSQDDVCVLKAMWARRGQEPSML